MIRISLPYLISITDSLNDLAGLGHEDLLNDVVFKIYQAKNQLETLIGSSVFAANLRSSRKLATDLIGILDSAANAPWSDKLSWRAFAVRQALEQFRTAFVAEIGTFPACFINQKGGYDTLTVLEEPSRIFPAGLFVKVPEAQFDAIEAGKSLCYELPTACGMHIFRVVETVLRRYYTEVSGGRPQPKVRNIGVYINALKQAGKGDTKVLGLLEHISRLHRNPLMHPDAALTLDEAISTLGMAHSVITAMLQQLPDAPLTTATALVAGHA